jgi:hypothetical protein
MPSKDQRAAAVERAKERQERLARELRANLSKRKALVRAKSRLDEGESRPAVPSGKSGDEPSG